MHLHDEDLFVVGSIEDADPAAFWESTLIAPEEVVIELLGGGLLEVMDVHAFGVETTHDMLDRAVLAGRVEALEDEQHPDGALGRESVLVVGKKADALGKPGTGLRLAAQPVGGAGVEVSAQPHDAAWWN